MSNYQEVVDILLEGRPQSSRESIERVVRQLGEVIAIEASRIHDAQPPWDEVAIWQTIKNRPVFQNEMQTLLREVDRMHILYVYSRFLGSKAIGPTLVKAALEG